MHRGMGHNTSTDPKNTRLRELSENQDFVYWSEENGFDTLVDYFGNSLASLQEREGFNPRFYKELLGLISKYNYGSYFEDYN